MWTKVGLGGATGLGLGVGNLAGVGMGGHRGGLEALTLGSLIGGLQPLHGLPPRDRHGETPGLLCVVLVMHVQCWLLRFAMLAVAVQAKFLIANTLDYVLLVAVSNLCGRSLHGHMGRLYA